MTNRKEEREQSWSQVTLYGLRITWKELKKKSFTKFEINIFKT